MEEFVHKRMEFQKASGNRQRRVAQNFAGQLKGQLVEQTRKVGCEGTKYAGSRKFPEELGKNFLFESTDPLPGGKFISFFFLDFSLRLDFSFSENTKLR